MKYQKFKDDFIWNGFIRALTSPFASVYLACLIQIKRENVTLEPNPSASTDDSAFIFGSLGIDANTTAALGANMTRLLQDSVDSVDSMDQASAPPAMVRNIIN